MLSAIFEQKKRLLSERPGAKGLSDVLLDEGIYKADFEIADRYTGFSDKVITFSLAGIAGYGFLISEIVMNLEKGESLIFQLKPGHLWIAAIGIVFLGVSLGLSLFHRFKCTSCLYDQILISRSLLRLQDINQHWTEEEKEHEREVLKAVRKCQQIEALRYQNILGWSSFCLFGGLLSVVVLFFIILTSAFSIGKQENRQKNKVVVKALDNFKEGIGRDTVRFGAQGYNQ